MTTTVSVSLISAVLLGTALAVSLGGQGSNLDHFSIFLDLGSTGTKLKLYNWTQSDQSGELPRVRLVKSAKVKPGIANLAGDLSKVKDYLQPIIETAEQMVPEGQREETPIFAMATAGFRYLAPAVSRSLMAEVQVVLSNHSLSPFRYYSADVQILSGEEEGVYAWVALNYLLDRFNTSSPSTETYGILEMGGGSTQIAFIPKDPLYASEFQVELAGQVYEVYVHSYLDYGLTSIQRRLADIVAGNGTEENPCLLKGDQKIYQLADGRTVTNVGSGDGCKCREMLWQLLKPATGENCEPKPCAIGTQYQPSVEGVPFYATQGFVYTPSDLKAIDADDDLDLYKLRGIGDQYCYQTLKEVVAKGMNPKFASAGCLESQYLPLLVLDAYKFPDDDVIKTTSKIDGERIDWALGAVLVELSRSLEFQSCVHRRRR